MLGSSHRATRPVLVALALACASLASSTRADPPPTGAGAGLPDDLLDDGPRAPQVIYRYKSSEGRTVFTNFEDSVPLAQRDGAVVDLSHVSLNTELGSEIDGRLRAQHETLLETGYCRDLRSEARTGKWTQLWDSYAPMIVCGGMLLAFLLFTPFALKRIGAPVWAKTLTMAIPALALAGLLMFAMTESNRMVGEVAARARPCEKETWDELSTEPQAVAKHAQLVDLLQHRIEAIDALAVPTETRGIGTR